MKKFLSSLIIILILPLLVSAINIYIDYRGVFHKSKFIEAAVSNQMKGINQVLFINYPEREMLKARIKKMQNTDIETVVIGTSRSLLLGKPTNLNLFNFSVSSANLIDYQEILKLMKIYNLHVKNIIFEFHDGLFVEEIHNRHEIFRGLSTSEKLKFIFSVDYLKDNLSKKSEILSTENDNEFKLFNDGSIDYKEEYYLLSQTSKKNKVQRRISILENKKFSKQRIRIFDSIIRNNTANTNIYFFISPLHPLVEKASDQYVGGLNNILDSILIRNPSIYIIGDLKPSEYHLSDSDFFDDIHLKPDGVEKIINNKYLLETAFHAN